MNGRTVVGNGDLAGALASQKPGTAVTITYVRSSTTQHSVKMTLGERSTNLGNR
ncbi:MAG: hypothetical protein ABI068_07645 [Ktedonobacterales bacterium]